MERRKKEGVRSKRTFKKKKLKQKEILVEVEIPRSPPISIPIPCTNVF